MPQEPRDQWGAPLYNALKRRLVPNLAPPTPGSPFVMGGRWYRQVDNGHADTLVPIDNPTISPMQRAQQRAAIERAFLMANSPLAGGAYGLSALMGARPQTQERAMMAGGAADALMQGVAPLGARGTRAVRPEATQPPIETLPRKSAVYEGSTETDQGVGMNARITRPMLDTGTKVKRGLVTPGLSDSPKANNQSRGHFLAKSLGGEANTSQQAFTATHYPTNSRDMWRFERDVRRRVRDGEIVDYFVRALYDAPHSPPSSILMSAQGSRGDFTPALIENPAGRR